MKAVWYDRTGPAVQVLNYGEWPDPQPGTGEVRVRLYASGVNPSDVKTRDGLRGPMTQPFQIPHSDGAGVIDAVGDGVSADRVGARVYVWNGAWRRPAGTCAQFICVPAEQALPLPDTVDFATGACLGIPAMTAAWALFADGDITGQTVLVAGGAGAVGEIAIQLARWAGATVIATVSSAEKAAVASAAGAHHVINYRNDDVLTAVMACTGDAGVDRVVEVEFGGNLALTAQIIKVGGVIAAYGSMASPTPELPFYALMFRNVTLRMLLVYLLNPAERAIVAARLAAAMADGALHPRIALRVPLDQAAAAHEAVESGAVESGALIGNVVIDIA